MARGDELARRACLARYGSLVHAIVRRFAWDPEDIAEASADAFAALWREAAAFDADRCEEAVFVTMVVRWTHRARARSKGLPTHAVPGTPVDISAASFARYADVRAALASVACASVDALNVMVLVVCHGLSLEDTSRELSLPLTRVRSHHGRIVDGVSRGLTKRAGSKQDEALAEAALLLAHLDPSRERMPAKTRARLRVTTREGGPRAYAGSFGEHPRAGDQASEAEAGL